MIEEIIINNRIVIPPGEIQFRFSRSGGPGGQNVNKVSTKAELLFDLGHSSAFDEEAKARIRLKLGRHIDSTGVLSVTAQESRSQFQNRQMAIEKFIALVTRALHVPRARKDSKPTFSSVKKRLERKTRRGAAKKRRSQKIEIE
jgi:ribosome-associated protein